MDEIEKHLRDDDHDRNEQSEAAKLDRLAKSKRIEALIERLRQLPQSDSISVATQGNIDRYQIISLVGEGAYARVYRAYDPKLQRYVAVKTAKQVLPLNEKLRDLFLREAQLAANLGHSGIIPIYDFGECSDHGCYLVMPVISGQTLQQILRCKPIPLQRSISLAISICEAMNHAHMNGLVHRDLKPANILIDDEGNAKIGDFGLAVPIDTIPAEQAEKLLGTPHYMSPEQVRRENHVIDARTDVWAFGVTFYEMLTRSKPFTSGTLDELFATIELRAALPVRSRLPDLPSVIGDIIDRCLQKRMSDRYSSFKDIADELRTINRGPVVQIDDVVNSKGLESYDENDAASFLQLLGGPYDHNGLPLSIRYWKDRIESSIGRCKFAMGVLCGPSGSGKSSFVRAGLIPNLADYVTSVIISASRTGTEQDIVSGLRRRYPQIKKHASLPHAIRQVREHLSTQPQLRLLIIIDHFEQWLLHNDPELSSLADGLGQCDGKVAVILLVRDEFWSKTLRFLSAAESPTSAPMVAHELMSIEHAVHVLAALGRAHKKLPRLCELTDSQQTFLRSAVLDMAEPDEKVMPIRLAIFTQMMASQSWDWKSLRKFGGTAGIGEQYLESLFGSGATLNRGIEQPIRRVLRELLPPATMAIRQNQINEQQIERICGDRPTTDRVIQTLIDSKLIVNVEASSDMDATYHLPHDYLVPLIRRWLERADTASARGRALRCLEERTQLWSTRKEPQQLPTFKEWATILAITKNSDRSPQQRQMLKVANRRRARQLNIVLAMLLVVVAITRLSSPRKTANRLVQELSVLSHPQEWYDHCLTMAPLAQYWASEFESVVDATKSDRRGGRGSAGLRRLTALLVAYDFHDAFDRPANCERVTRLVQNHPPKDWIPTIRQLRNPDLSTLFRQQVELNDRRLASVFAEHTTELNRMLETSDFLSPEDAPQISENHLESTQRFILAAYSVGEPELLAEAMDRHPDPRLATLLTSTISKLLQDEIWSGKDYAQLLAIAERSDGRPGFLQSVIHAGILWQEKSGLRLPPSIILTMQRLHAESPDSGVHSATIRFFTSADRFPDGQANHAASIVKPYQRRQWGQFAPDLEYATIAIETPSETTKTLHVGVSEISRKVFSRYCSADMEASADPNAPAIVRHQDAMLFCYQVNERHGLEQCYVLDNAGFVRPLDDYHERGGVRLPLLHEWTAACRAGTDTYTYAGFHDERFLDYERFNEVDKRGFYECRMGLPNQFGLFDTWGNAQEWLQETALREDNFAKRRPMLHTRRYSPDPEICRPFDIGGSVRTRSSLLNMHHKWFVSMNYQARNGFRVVASPSYRRLLAKDMIRGK